MLKRLIEVLNEKGLDAQSFLFLYALVNNIQGPQFEIDYKQLRIKGYWKFPSTGDSIENITPEGIEFIKYVVKELKKEIRKEIKQGDEDLRNSIKEWIDDYRNLFKGTKVGIMGDPKACLDKMVRFFQEYPQFANKDIVMKTTEAYIQSEANHNYKYLQRADYFIYKLVGKEETSRLAGYCEEDKQIEQSFTKML
jgi:hypothetical protein